MPENHEMTIWKDRKHHMWWPLSFQRYEIRNDRLYQTSGFLSTTVDELLLYRIIDLKLKQSLLQKLFGTGTILLTTKGDSDAVIPLVNIKTPMKVRELISREVEHSRIHYNVVGREFYGGTPHAHGDGFHAGDVFTEFDGHEHDMP